MNNNDKDKVSRTAFAELQTINRVLDRISRIQETNHILSVIVDELTRACQADQGVINLTTRMKDLDLVTVVRHEDHDDAKVPFKLNDRISGWVLKNRQQALIADLENDSRFPGLSSENGRFTSIICCPMIDRDDVIGLVSLTRNQSQPPFDSDTARLAGILAAQAAPILKNSLLLKELAEKNRLLEISQQQLRDENSRLRADLKGKFAFESIVGESPVMKEVLTLASKVSANDSPVLITGPTGTGKELIARAVHYHSPRANKPFVVKNCGVKTETLLEAELFGHVKGAFTGAVSDKPGLFREADGGTIFLDEIGEAPMSTQVAVLRVLETGEIRPVGSTRTEHVDVRVISATNRDLEKAMQDGTIRQDLYFRLNTFTIELPSLSARPQDIPLLANHFAKAVQAKLGLPELRLTSEALDCLCRYSWPGNVRQLENEIERAAVVAGEQGVIDVRDLSPAVKSGGGDLTPVARKDGSLKEIVEDVEREVIARVLAENGGNISRSAELLGLTRKGLRDKKERYGLE